MTRLLHRLANLFPLWVLLTSGLALHFPGWFDWFQGPLIVWGLAFIMLSMGITLTLDDFRRVRRRPRQVLAGVVAQFGIMPFLGWIVARGMHLDPALAVGLILVACCPGGTASNVVSYIARADVALSVLMTTASTFAAVGLTPLLTKALAGAYVPVGAWGLFVDTLQVVVLPVSLGLFLRHFFPRVVRAVHPFAPLLSVVFIALICASIIGANAATIKASALKLFCAVALLHVGGFALGYVFARLLGYPRMTCRTVSIEVGMQNSGLGAVLARSSFPDLLLAPVPAAISASFHSLLGSLLAAWWRMRSSLAEPEAPPVAAVVLEPEET